MSLSEVYGLGERAVARRSDPDTSHDAALSVRDIKECRQAVLALFRLYGPMTDSVLVERAKQCGVRWSESGLRTRRKEVTFPNEIARPHLENTGRTETLKSGREAIVWAIQE